jgi:hypothetical protein
MSKIVSAVNAMIKNEAKISSVLLSENDEIFFRYDDKYNWSVKKTEDETWLWFYPGESDVDYLASLDEFEGVAMVTYKLSDIGTREAKQTFYELYAMLKEKLYGVDDVLDDIIADGSGEIPF